MRPRIGFYPYDHDLFYVLLESLDSVSNRTLLHNLIMSPVYSIQDAFHAGKSNPYILRERYRKWVEYLDDHLPFGTDYLPHFDDLVTHDDVDHDTTEALYDLLYSDREEWVLFGNVDAAYEIIDQVHEALFNCGDPRVVIEKMLQADPGIRELILVDLDQEGVYVIRSTYTEDCGDISARRFHVFDNLGDAAGGGGHPTYVLPPDVVAEFLETVREAEERVAAC